MRLALRTLLTLALCAALAGTAAALGPGPGPDWITRAWRGISFSTPPDWKLAVDSPDMFVLSFTPRGAAMANEGYTLAAGLYPGGLRPEAFAADGDEVSPLGEVEISGQAMELFEVRTAEFFLLACRVTEPLADGSTLGLAFGASPAMDRDEYLPLFERILYTLTIDREAFFPPSDQPAQGDDHVQSP